MRAIIPRSYLLPYINNNRYMSTIQKQSTKLWGGRFSKDVSKDVFDWTNSVFCFFFSFLFSLFVLYLWCGWSCWVVLGVGSECTNISIFRLFPQHTYTLTHTLPLYKRLMLIQEWLMRIYGVLSPMLQC